MKIFSIIIMLFKFSIALSQGVTDLSKNISGKFIFEQRFFNHKGIDDQNQWRSSIALEPEWGHQFSDSSKIFAKLFARWDQHDTNRTHADVRELLWDYSFADFIVSIGIGKVFWGVAETRHLVDIINQTDLVENIDEEDKLGQPWVRFTWDKTWGTFDFFILPYFRERTFPGPKGRLRSYPRVDKDHPIFESSREEKHIDFALRYAHSFDIWDIGINYFHGTSREPRFFMGFIHNESVFIPVYDIIQQLSSDIQATVGNWLYKFEILTRSGQGPTFNALVGGFEYTYVGWLGSNFDLGLLVEYHRDRRSIDQSSVFNDDIASGIRFAANDAGSSELLFFLLYDKRNNSKLYRLEASRRFGNHLKLELEGTIFSNINEFDPLFAFSRDKHVQVELIYFF